MANVSSKINSKNEVNNAPTTTEVEVGGESVFDLGTVEFSLEVMSFIRKNGLGLFCFEGLLSDFEKGIFSNGYIMDVEPVKDPNNCLKFSTEVQFKGETITFVNRIIDGFRQTDILILSGDTEGKA